MNEQQERLKRIADEVRRKIRIELVSIAASLQRLPNEQLPFAYADAFVNIHDLHFAAPGQEPTYKDMLEFFADVVGMPGADTQDPEVARRVVMDIHRENLRDTNVARAEQIINGQIVAIGASE